MSLVTTQNDHSESYIRWVLNERIQHWALASSFFILVITGFALKYPDVWWVKPFSGIDWLFNLRGIMHRLAGTVFMVLGVYHLLYIAFVKRGRLLIRELLLKKKDFRDMRQNIAFNLGLRKEPPEFAHFNYMEKIEYWALIWGAIIMSITGIMLWFENITLTFFPKWVIDVITVIHLYEAWLATLAIFIWHFYFVIFDPDIYPINTAMVDGRISKKELQHTHTAEWDELTEQNQEPQSETKAELKEAKKTNQ